MEPTTNREPTMSSTIPVSPVSRAVYLAALARAASNAACRAAERAYAASVGAPYDEALIAIRRASRTDQDPRPCSWPAAMQTLADKVQDRIVAEAILEHAAACRAADEAEAEHLRLLTADAS